MTKVLILRGIPGSGKTSLIENMRETFKGRIEVCSADHFFMQEGKYKFEPSKLGLAHSACMRKFIDQLQWRPMDAEQEIERLIVVDNTSLGPTEWSPYVLVAQAMGVPVRILTLRFDRPIEALSRNTHGVPVNDAKAQMFQERMDDGSSYIGPWIEHSVVNMGINGKINIEP